MTSLIICLVASGVVCLYICHQSLYSVSQHYVTLTTRLDKLENNINLFQQVYIHNSSHNVKFPLTTNRLNVSNDILSEGTPTKFAKIKLIRSPKCKYDYKLIILVQSRISHFSQRMIIRNTWGRSPSSDKKKWKTFFLVARSKYEQDSMLLNREFDEFEDIIIGDTYEDFYTLSLKLYMGFQWSIMHCKYKYILKTDDDVFVNIRQLFTFLHAKNTPKVKLFAGNVQYRAFVFRTGRYGVSEDEYKKDVYPRYCSGGGYVLSADVVKKMHENVNKVTTMKIDDAYVGELALLSGVDTFHDDNFNMYVEKCVYNETLIVYHPIKSRACMETLFETQTKSEHMTNMTNI